MLSCVANLSVFIRKLDFFLCIEGRERGGLDDVNTLLWIHSKTKHSE